MHDLQWVVVIKELMKGTLNELSFSSKCDPVDGKKGHPLDEMPQEELPMTQYVLSVPLHKHIVLLIGIPAI